MNRYLRIGEAAPRLEVCTKEIRRWDAIRKIHCQRTVGDHRRIAILEIARLTQQENDPPKPPREVVFYCCVSSHDQKKKGDPPRQVTAAKTYCYEQDYRTPQFFQDTASGLNTKHKGLDRLCQLIER